MGTLSHSLVRRPAEFCRVAVHIGQELRRKVKESHIPITRFASMVGCTPKTIHAVFKRPSMDTMLLRKCSEVLRYDFFALYTNELAFLRAASANATADPAAAYGKRGDQGMEIIIRPGKDREFVERLLKAMDNRKRK